MDSTFKQAREWLNNATRTEFERVLDEAMLSEEQKQISRWRRAGVTNVAIALRLHCDTSTVDRQIRKIYKMVSKVLLL